MLYSGEFKSDTFKVTWSLASFDVVDNRVHTQIYNYISIELTDSCPEAMTIDCSGFDINRKATKDYISIHFRNFIVNININYNRISYQIGSETIKDVYVAEIPEPSDWSERDIKKVYYTNKYGIIAYELFTGELFELDGMLQNNF